MDEWFVSVNENPETASPPLDIPFPVYEDQFDYPWPSPPVTPLGYDDAWMANIAEIWNGDDRYDDQHPIWNQIGGANTEDDDPLLSRPSHFYDIVNVFQQRVRRFNTTGTTFDIRIRRLDESPLPERALEAVFRDIFDQALQGASANAFVGAEIRHPTALR